ncbi:DinB family protein [uncultured Pontibacter sp.]|uniref:DinB family protein n=1 Tax=uncultured Pontibacter sp. TaxID=453356 RepID=UPI0026097055|nr:DinB family protein [uncultured Pontibacter sp.]
MNTTLFSHIQLMNPVLESRYLKLEESRNRLIGELEGLDEELLNRPAATGKWSINQIVAHLIQVEQLTNSYIQRKVQEEELESASLAHTLRSLLLRVALHSGMKFKAPAAVAKVPAHASLNSLRIQWDAARYQLEDTLTELPRPLLDKCVFRHPYAGMLTITQTLAFLQDHFDHHARQISRLRQQWLK